MDNVDGLRRSYFGGNLKLSYDSSYTNTLDGKQKYVKYPTSPLSVQRGEAARLFGSDGKSYIDLVNNPIHVGHSNPDVIKAVCHQAGQLMTNTRYLHPTMVRAAQMVIALCNTDSMDVCYFVNSGSEACDLALRLALAHTSSKQVMCMDHAYHGNSSLCLAVSPYKMHQATHNKGILGGELCKFQQEFRSTWSSDSVGVLPLPGLGSSQPGPRNEARCTSGYQHCSPSTENAHSRSHVTGETKSTGATCDFYQLDPPITLRASRSEALSCGQQATRAVERRSRSHRRCPVNFIHESVVGCGGQVPLLPEYTREVYRAVHETGGLVICDEVQTGFYRYSPDHAFVWQLHGSASVPDILVLGKPIANGYPVGCVVTSKAIARSFDRTGMEFFSTFGGNPVCCAAVVATLTALNQPPMGLVTKNDTLRYHAYRVGTTLVRRLRKLQQQFPAMIEDVRGSGLFLGIELTSQQLAKHVKNFLYVEHNVLISTDGPEEDVLKVKPPMCISARDLQTLVDGLKEALVWWQRAHPRSSHDQRDVLLKPKTVLSKL